MISAVEKHNLLVLERETELQKWSASLEMQAARHNKLGVTLQQKLNNLKQREDQMEQLWDTYSSENQRTKNQAHELEQWAAELKHVKEEISQRNRDIEVSVNDGARPVRERAHIPGDRRGIVGQLIVNVIKYKIQIT